MNRWTWGQISNWAGQLWYRFVLPFKLLVRQHFTCNWIFPTRTKATVAEKTLNGSQTDRKREREKESRENECVFCVDKCILQNATGHNKGCLLRHMIERKRRRKSEADTEGGSWKNNHTHTHSCTCSYHKYCKQAAHFALVAVVKPATQRLTATTTTTGRATATSTATCNVRCGELTC